MTGGGAEIGRFCVRVTTSVPSYSHRLLEGLRHQ